MLRLHKFDSQLQCIELNYRKTWTKYIKSKQTLHDMRDNKTKNCKKSFRLRWLSVSAPYLAV